MSSVKTASKKRRKSDFETVYYSLFFYGNRIILYSERLNPKYSLFILFLKPLFIIHYSASIPETSKRLSFILLMMTMMMMMMMMIKSLLLETIRLNIRESLQSEL